MPPATRSAAALRRSRSGRLLGSAAFRRPRRYPSAPLSGGDERGEDARFRVSGVPGDTSESSGSLFLPDDERDVTVPNIPFRALLRLR